MSNTPAHTNAIAIVGMAGRFPGAQSADELWTLVRNGREAIRRLPDAELRAAGVPAEQLSKPHYVKAAATLEGMDTFDAGFFGFSPRDAAIMDPQHRHFLEVAWEALERAGHMPETFGGSIGVFGGCGMQAYFAGNLLNNAALMSSAGLFLVRHTGNDKDFLTTRVSYQLNLRGPSVSVQTACSTSLVAVHLACQSLLGGECDMALAGGATIELPHGRGYVYEEGEILSPDGHCRAFDASSKGTVFGSGIGIVVLRRLEDALADGDHVHAIIVGSAVNNDGAGKVGYLAPSVEGQAAVVAEAMALAGVDAESIGYIETHGTGTPVGDPIEVAALAEAFGRHTAKRGFCAIGSIKTNIGHLDTAAGVASLFKAVSAVEHAELPPSLYFETPNPAIPFTDTPFFVNAKLKPWITDGPRRAGVTSLGVGGTNAHVLIEQAPARPPTGDKSPNLLVWSARSEAAIEAGTGRLAGYLEEHQDLPVADVAWTLQTGRRAFERRRALVADSTADAVRAFADASSRRVIAGTAHSPALPVVFLFPGGGAQFPNMGREIYEREPVFREVLDRGLALLEREHGILLRPSLFPAPGNEAAAARTLEQSTLSILSVFLVEYALGRLWMHWGVTPDAMTGHSLGEYAAACLAGVFSFEDALRIVKARGDVFAKLAPGAMLSVPLPEADVRAMLTGSCGLAAVNAPALTVVSGPIEEIDRLEASLRSREIDAKRLHIAVAAHSTMLEPYLPEFAASLSRITFHEPQLPFISNVTGRWAEASEVATPGYWVRHLRQPVRFVDGIATLLGDTSRLMIEVGPGHALTSFVRAYKGPEAQTITSMRHPHERGSDLTALYRSVGHVWVTGREIDWKGFQGQEARRRVPLPTYPFEHQRYWIDADPRPIPEISDALERSARDTSTWMSVPVWKPVELNRASPNGEPANWLLFAADQDWVALAARLRARGHAVTTVTAGERSTEGADRYAVDPRRAADFEALFEALGRKGAQPFTVVYGWASSNALAGEPALIGLLHLAQALNGLGGAKVHLVVLTAGLARIGDNDRVQSPEQALVAGAVKVIAREVPELSSAWIDVADSAMSTSSPSSESEIDFLIGALSTPGGRAEMALREGRAWTREWKQLPRTALAGKTSIRANGVYVITGGLGGIALTLAEALARTERVRLFLLARRAIDADQTSDGARRIRSIEALGSRVEVEVCDVANAGEVKATIDRIRAGAGDIHGVIHAAGVLNDELLSLKTADSAAKVLAPKVAGTQALAAALDDVSLDFWLNCSSVSAMLGLPGQFDYAAANAYLDAFAEYRAARPGDRTVSVAWQAWRDVGMLAPKRIAESLGAANGDPVAQPFVQRMQATAADTRSAALFSESDWALDEHRLTGGDALLPGTALLEVLFETVRSDGGSAVTELSEVVFIEPFRAADGPRVLRTTIDNNTGEAVMSSGQELATEHVRATVRREPLASGPQLDVAAIRARCSRMVIDPVPNLRHLRTGPRWASAVTLQLGAGECFGEITFPSSFVAELPQYVMHPALVDVATACAVRLADEGTPERYFFVPLSYGRVIARRSLAPTVLVHATLHTTGTNAPDLALLDVTIADQSGEPLVVIERLAMRRLAPFDRLASGRAGQTGPDLSSAITPMEGAAAFLHVLRALPLPRVTVGPATIEALESQQHAALHNTRDTPHREADRPVVEARDDVDRSIAGIWTELLGVPDIGIDDNFFELGGHSLLLTQVGSRLRRVLKVQVPIAVLFEQPTIRHIGDHVRRQARVEDEPALVAIPRESLRRPRASIATRPPSRSHD